MERADNIIKYSSRCKQWKGAEKEIVPVSLPNIGVVIVSPARFSVGDI